MSMFPELQGDDRIPLGTFLIGPAARGRYHLFSLEADAFGRPVELTGDDLQGDEWAKLRELIAEKS